MPPPLRWPSACGTRSGNLLGSALLVVKVTDLWPSCHEFEPGTAMQRGPVRVKYVELKRPPVGVVWKLGESSASSGVVLVT
ncbi:hypothetical protein TNCV_831881 [Trichonephila clavipes]|nr:hypothetical protein TNCV_831881 [Trichonephila clavipes]